MVAPEYIGRRTKRHDSKVNSHSQSVAASLPIEQPDSCRWRPAGRGHERTPTCAYLRLHPPQPPHQISAIDEQSTATGRCQCIREHLCERLPLEIEIRAGVAHRRVQSSVAEPLTDCREVDAGLEQGDSRAVPDRVRVELLASEGRSYS
jgi:hypothetical protein